jgi:predicted dehydrogenase
MLRLGIVDFDSSHCIEYTRRVNHVGLSADQYVDGARVVAGWPGTSDMSPERIDGFRVQMADVGVEIVDSAEALVGRIDAVLILSLCGSAHLSRVRPFLEAGIPAYVDKPFACTVADAVEMVELARRTGTLLLHASALRFADEVHEFRRLSSRLGAVHGLLAYGPAKRAPGNPGLLHYGIHAIEVLYALMGPGCERVTAAHTDGADVVTGQWHDGRLATFRGARRGSTAYGLLGFCDQAVFRNHVSTQNAYRNLLRAVIESFTSGRPLVPHAETLEVTRFALAALESENRGGRPVDLEVLN